MKKIIYKYFFVAFISFWMQHTKAQDPNWSVNAASYQYSMTFTAFLNVDGTTLTASNDKVAAFVNGELRGVANVLYVSSANKYVTYLSVYANTNNETIRFKIYNSGTNSTVNIDKTETFSIDEHKGGVFQSYSIASPVLGNNALFNSFKFEGISATSEEISSDKINIVVPENTDLTALTSVFSASQNARVYVAGVLQVSGNGVKDFTNPVIYNVLSEDEAVYKEYEVSVSVALNNDPVTVAVSSAVNLNTNTIPVSLDIVFSKVVTGFGVSDFILENTAISALTTSDFKTYKVEVVPFSQGDFSVQIPANSALDENNNQNQISNKIIFTYDITKPIITDISIDNDANSLGFLVTFSEDVLNVGVSDFELKGMGSNNVAVSSINLIANNQYKVALSNTNLDEGTISLQLKNTSDIKDISENLIVLSEFEAYFLNNISSLSNSVIAKMFIEGAYNVNSGMMDDDLRVKGYIPLNSPYSDALIVGQDVLNVSGTNAIVDWVWMEIRDGSNEITTAFATSALIQRDGDIVDVDGVSPIKIELPLGSYYVVISHRNHLGVRTNESVLFSGATINLNLSNNSALVLGNVNAIKVMSDGKFALFSGDFNGDGQIQNTDKNAVEPLRGISGYRNADMDMNGEVQNSDLNSVLIPNIGKGKQYSSKGLNAKRKRIN